MRQIAALFLGAMLSLNLPLASADQGSGGSYPIQLRQLQSSARVVRDQHHIAHVEARSEHDVFLLQGWVHAQDRLFQMDTNRRLASGTLAELLGLGALESDVTLRTIGLRRAAERSLAASLPETLAALQAYADGVNAWVRSHPLPPEYGVLEVTKFQPWAPVDSVVIGKLIAFDLSFTTDAPGTLQFQAYVQAGKVLGFDGAKLFYEDVFRSAPFDPALTVPDASLGAAAVERGAAPAPYAPRADLTGEEWMHPRALELAHDYVKILRRIPLFEGILDENKRGGSNLWAVAGSLTDTGRPLIANDPHLQLGTPSTFYPMGLAVMRGLEVFGECLPGSPGIIHGYNRHISWGSTNLALDVTDTYQEQVVPDPASPSGLSTLYRGRPEPIIPIPEIFRTNQPGNGVPDDLVVVPPGGAIPAFTLIVPRRNNGPIIRLDPRTGIALSVQYVGFSPTREQDAFLKIDRASNLAQFVEALQFLDVGAQNFVYADDEGNIGYFTSGELPIREDLQAGTVNGNPPWFIRNGQGGNEWLPVQHLQPQQAVPYEILPFSEMPKVVNPLAGFVVNSNNDPVGVTLGNNPLGQQRAGGGIYYLAYAFNRGFRAGRITERINEYLTSGDRRISFRDMQSIQADVKLRDAQVFVPYILQAFQNAKRQAAPALLAGLTKNQRTTEAVERLTRWTFATPTGIDEGYDGSDRNGRRLPPTPAQIKDSVAATVYGVWRTEFIKATIDAQVARFTTGVPFELPFAEGQSVLAALRNLLDNFSQNHGVGASGLNFFQVTGLSIPEDARDYIILNSLARALDALAGDAFDIAFHKSTNLGDYRWGKLHRIVFVHPLGGPFNVPPAGGVFPDPLAGLPGIPVDGGFQTVDAATHDVRAEGANEFMFALGPVRRFVSEPSWREPYSESIWPGGTSGVLGSPWYLNFLSLWLTNDAIPLLLDHGEVQAHADEVDNFAPARR